MKKFLLIPCFIVNLILPILAKEGVPQERSMPFSDMKMIDEVLADYQAGNYHHFLKKADDDYREARKKNGKIMNF